MPTRTQVTQRHARTQSPASDGPLPLPKGRRSARKPSPASPQTIAPTTAPSDDESLSRDSYAATAFADIVDRSMHAATARFTAGLSPIAFTDAYLDWASHLAFLPGKRSRLVEKAVKKILRFGNYAARSAWDAQTAPCIVPLAQDHRFDHPGWQQFPFSLVYQSFLLNQQWWHNAMTGVRGVTRQHESMVTFATRQMLDVVSPSNFVATNPEVLQATRAEESRYVDPDAWLAQATRREGSWWPEWMEWLSARSGAEVTPPQLGTEDAPYRAIADAPGTYVRVR